ncbi:hypothetical protein [Acidipropionibacterium timonense]|uniref:hypothetical protein n=1 Tax=Acidipropionibacterium timonense TaxID=2161818 RepID=UPI001030AAF8|nr:hypothetical protein [Acidipropionibacterium timonense]
MTNRSVEELRRWAGGMDTLAAGVELLLGITAAGERVPGARRAADGHAWIDSDAIAVDTAASSASRQAVAVIAASLIGGTPVDLSVALVGLDPDHGGLVLAAVARAAATVR